MNTKGLAKGNCKLFTGIRFDIKRDGHVMHFEIVPSEIESHHLGYIFTEPVIELYYSVDDFGPKDFAVGIPTDDEIEIDSDIFIDYIDTYIDSMLTHYLEFVEHF